MVRDDRGLKKKLGRTREAKRIYPHSSSPTF